MYWMAGSEAFSSIEPELVRSFKRSEYDRMVELGLFQDERVELIRGVLVKISPQLASHASTVQKLNQLLMARLQGRFTLRIQSPLALSDDTSPSLMLQSCLSVTTTPSTPAPRC